jgi:mRNA-degrading endonuclease RelE of RelBE toxin-antitoxin system
MARTAIEAGTVRETELTRKLGAATAAPSAKTTAAFEAQIATLRNKVNGLQTDLRNKVSGLQTDLRTANDEKAGLRKKLTVLEAREPKESRERERDEAEPAAPVDTGPKQRRDPLLPTIERSAAAGLSLAPPRVRADALRTIGQLAAGDELPWKYAKRPTGAAAGYYVLRIGMDYRMIFQVDDDRLLVREFSTTEAFTRTLSSYLGRSRD